jgi:hypothetical protein
MNNVKYGVIFNFSTAHSSYHEKFGGINVALIHSDFGYLVHMTPVEKKNRDYRLLFNQKLVS